jgi:hypothetical protein
MFMKFCIWLLFWKSVAKICLSLKSNKHNRYFTWRPKYFLIISHSVLLGMRNVSDKLVEIKHTHYIQ